MERESGSSCPLSIEKTKVEGEEGEKGRSAKEIEYRCSPRLYVAVDPIVADTRCARCDLYFQEM